MFKRDEATLLEETEVQPHLKVQNSFSVLMVLIKI